MAALPTLRRELIGAFAVIFAGALFVTVTGVVIVVPRLTPVRAAVYVVTLLVAVVAIFLVFGAALLRRRLLDPLERMVVGVEAISGGDSGARLPAPESREMERLSAAVTQMAEGLNEEKRKLAENIRSLNETNRLLTEARDAMIRSEKLASVGRLGAGIAHEVGNPLGAVMGYLAVLAKQADGRDLELLRAAEREAQRIDRIVRGLLDFARPREVVAQDMDMNAVVRETVELVQTQGHFNGMELAVELCARDASVRGDWYQMQQVFVNLFVNAADALESVPDPRVSVRTLRRRAQPPPTPAPARRKEDPPGIDYSHRRRLARASRWPAGDPESESGEVVEVVVADNGPGIPVELLDQVFEPFITTKEPGRGTGLGLAVSASIVEAMGGTIRAASPDGGGAVFHIVLPALAAEDKA